MTYLLIYFLINLFLTIQEALSLADKRSELKKYKGALGFMFLFGAPTCVILLLANVAQYLINKQK